MKENYLPTVEDNCIQSSFNNYWNTQQRQDGSPNRKHDSGICCVPGVLLFCVSLSGIFCAVRHI